MIEHKIFSCERFMTSSLAVRLSLEIYKAAFTKSSCNRESGQTMPLWPRSWYIEYRLQKWCFRGKTFWITWFCICRCLSGFTTLPLRRFLHLVHWSSVVKKGNQEKGEDSCYNYHFIEPSNISPSTGPLVISRPATVDHWLAEISPPPHTPILMPAFIVWYRSCSSIFRVVICDDDDIRITVEDHGRVVKSPYALQMGSEAAGGRSNCVQGPLYLAACPWKLYHIPFFWDVCCTFS